jgi:hypothetical protein
MCWIFSVIPLPMSPRDLLNRLHDEPFRPFRVRLTNNTTIDINEAGFAWGASEGGHWFEWHINLATSQRTCAKRSPRRRSRDGHCRADNRFAEFLVKQFIHTRNLTTDGTESTDKEGKADIASFSYPCSPCYPWLNFCLELAQRTIRFQFSFMDLKLRRIASRKPVIAR